MTKTVAPTESKMRPVTALRDLHARWGWPWTETQTWRMIKAGRLPAPFYLKGSRLALFYDDELAALLAEGRLQRNCVGAYAPLVSAGTCFIYRVDMPERSTLAIEPAAHGWRIRELVGPANSPVSPGTVAAVQAWLDDAARPRRPR